MINKVSIIDEYIKTRPPENDTVSETYRWWVNEKFYLPLSIEEIKEKWRKYLSKNNNPLIDFYIHIPFCYKKCHYCFYYKEVYKKESLDNYLEYLEQYLTEFIDVFKWVKFKSLYFWWWTPTLLSVKQINKLLGFVKANFSFHDWAEITFEWNPLSYSKEKIETLTTFWVNRVSMWVQSLDQEVLKSSNREYQNIEMITDSMNYLRKNGIKNINIDLIMWLKDDTVEKFWYTIQEIIKMNPYSITIYWLWPTKLYLDKYYLGDIDVFFKELNSKIDDYYDYIITNKNKFWKKIDLNIDKANWHIWGITLKSNEDNKLKYCYNDFWEWSLFWVWPSSRSHIFWELVYKTISDLDYNTHNHKDVIKEIINFGDVISIDDEISLYVITEMRDRLRIKYSEFFEKFWVDFLEYYKEEIEYFLTEKLIKISATKVDFNIDISKRLHYSLFFISKKRLVEKDIINNKNINSMINYDKNWIKFIIFLYFDGEIKFKIINNDTSSGTLELSSKHIWNYYKLVKKIEKVISILNRDKKEIQYSVKFLKVLLESI